MAERRTGDGDLVDQPEAVVELLLHGMAGVHRPQRGLVKARILSACDRDMVALYRAHQAAIDAEARRRGLRRPWVADLVADGAR